MSCGGLWEMLWEKKGHFVASKLYGINAIVILLVFVLYCICFVICIVIMVLEVNVQGMVMENKRDVRDYHWRCFVEADGRKED